MPAPPSERKCRLRDAYKAASQAAQIDQCAAGWTCRGSDGTSTEKWQPVLEFRLKKKCIPSQTDGTVEVCDGWQLSPSTVVIFIFDFFFIFIFKQKSENGSGEMGAKVDPAVSSGCCGAPSPTRLRPSPLPRSLSLSFSAGRGEMICGSEEGRNNGSRCVQEITELPLWPKNCVSRRPLWFFSPSSQDFAPLLRTLGDSSEIVL